MLHAQTTAAERPLVREIRVPFDDLNVLLEAGAQRVFLTRKEYSDLLGKARKQPAVTPAPQGAIVLSAEYDAVLEAGRAKIDGILEIEVLEDGLHALDLPISGLGVRDARVDQESAAIGIGKQGLATLFLQGVGRHQLRLEMVAPVRTSAAQQTLEVRLPTPAATQMQVVVPGNVEVKSGAHVIKRSLNEAAEATTFQLLVPRGPMTLVMSLNNRMLQQQQVVIARSVVIDEVTAAYERLHATISWDVLHGAADRFRIVIPDGFEPTEVTGPLLARWEVGQDQGQRVLNIRLREPATETVVANISATRTPAQLEGWSMPQLAVQDVAGQVSVVGLVVEDRLAVESLVHQDLIPLDLAVLTAALPPSVLAAEPGAPRVRPIAAFYAPQAAYTIDATFAKPPARFQSTTNLLLVVNDTGHQVLGGFALVPEVEKLFSVRFTVPDGWDVTEVTAADGSPLSTERVVDPKHGAIMRVRLPQGTPTGEVVSVSFNATHTPPGWLGEWDEQQVDFPRFVVLDAARDIGAIAVRAEDNLEVRPDELTDLTPLNQNDKAAYGLGDVASNLAYRYDGQPYAASLQLTRMRPWTTARCFSFLRISPEGLSASYELFYDIQRASARQLELRLPKDTPESLSIRGLEGLVVKEFNSQDEENSRIWTVLLAEPVQGVVRLAVDFQQPLKDEDAEGYPLPLVVAENVAYQSAVVAIEGHSELDIDVHCDARRVDVGELVAANYQVGRRLLGVFGFAGTDQRVSVDIHHREGYALPVAIVQHADIVTALAASGVSQTSAHYQLRTKASFLEVNLPANSQLWSVYLDQKPIAPQRDGDRVLLSLPAISQSELRDLQIVYQTQLTPVLFSGDIRTDAPALLVRMQGETESREVPVADIRWNLILPAGHQLVDSRGTVFTDRLRLPELPVWNVAGALVAMLGGIHSPMALQSARESARRTKNWLPHSGMGDFDSEPSAATAESVEFDSYEMADDGAAAGVELDMLDVELDMELEDQSGPQPDGAEAGAGQPSPTKPQLSVAVPPAANAPTTEPTDQPAQPETPPEFHDRTEGLLTFSLDSSVQLYNGQSESFWMLKGTRSLQIDLQEAGDQITFQGLGVAPRLDVTLVNANRVRALAWGIAAGVFAFGLLLTRRTNRTKSRYVLLVAVVALLLPLVIGRPHFLGDTFQLVFYAACLLVLVYLGAGLLRWLGTRIPAVARRLGFVTAGLLVVAIVSTGPAFAQPENAPAAPGGFDLDSLRELLAPLAPVQLPEDAVIIPYDLDGAGAGLENADRVLVPYAKYVELWNRAFPDQRLQESPPVVDYSLAGATFQATLTDEETLIVRGQIDLMVFVDKPLQVPLMLEQGVLAAATLDGEPARLRIVEPVQAKANAPAQQQQAANQAESQMPETVPAAMALLQVSGSGRKRLDLTIQMKLERRGGWRVVSGRLPVAPVTSLVLTVPSARTEVRLDGNVDRNEFETTADNEQIATALNQNGSFSLQWRAKGAESRVDQSLTVRSEAVLDVQEDGLRVTWQLNMEFPRFRHDTFTIGLPSGYLVERVQGDNVRLWKAETVDGRQRLDVTLLNEAQDRETLTLHLSRRGGLAADGPERLDVPVISVDGAVLHRGRLTVRRSPWIDLRAVQASGVSRTDLPQKAVEQLTGGDADKETPLGLRPFQAYEFTAMPFRVALDAAPVPSDATARVRTLLRIAEREARLESRVTIEVHNRPVHRVRLLVPENLEIENVAGPGEFQWSESTQADGHGVNVFLASGQTTAFSVDIRGSLGRRNGGDPVGMPRLTVLDVQRQQGEMVVQVDPAYDVRTQGRVNCEEVLLSQAFGWLQSGQRDLARLALRYQGIEYDATFVVNRRQARVSGFTVTNIKLTDIAIEETIILDVTIADAGIDRLVFRLPKGMEQARVSSPMLRQKTIEAVNDDWTRYTLDLQDEILGQFRVLIENDRALPDDGGESAMEQAPIPILETGRTNQRYVTLENAGRDEVVAVEQRELQPLGRQQTEWRTLASILGEGITTAYLVQNDARDPSLGYTTKQRKTVETAGAAIGLGETLLIVDANGAYRGRQTYQVNNTTEQYLIVQLPEQSVLWTATVSGEPVKPTPMPGGAQGQLRIPLIKTAEGDRDYPVVLKYGGTLTGKLSNLRTVRFPLIHTVNINVELSQVRLRLPEEYRWFDFGGSMRQILDVGEYKANYLSYNLDEMKRLMQAWNSDNPYAKVRSANNLKQIGLALQSYHDTYKTFMSNPTFNSNYAANTGFVEQAQQQTEEYFSKEESVVADDNRRRLNSFWMEQKNGLANNVVQDLGGNFDSAVVAGKDAEPNVQFNTKWFKRNQLENEPDKQKKPQQERFSKGRQQQDVGRQLKAFARDNSLLQSRGKTAQPESGGEDSEAAARQAIETAQQQVNQQKASIDSLAQRQSQQTLTREYREQLEQQAQTMPPQRGQGQMPGQAGYGNYDALAGQVLDDSRSMGPSGLGERPDISGEQGIGGGGFGIGVNSDSGVTGQIVLGPEGWPLAPPTGAAGATPSHLASLDVQLPERGTEFLFTTPRGEIKITARTVSDAHVNRWLRALAILAGLLGLWIVTRVVRRVVRLLADSKWTAAALVFVGLFLIIAGVFPIAGLAAIAIGLVQLLRIGLRSRVPAATPV